MKRCGMLMWWAVINLSLSITLTVLVSPMIYRIFVIYNPLQQTTQLFNETLVHNYDVLWKYLITPWQMHLKFPNFISSAAGLQHFADVKQLLWLNGSLTVIGLGLTPYFVKNIREKGQQLWYESAIRILYLVPIVMMVVIAFAFEPLFLLFHQVIFANDLWLFNPITDPIILALPTSFFMVLFIVAFGWYMLLIGILSKYIQ